MPRRALALASPAGWMRWNEPGLHRPFCRGANLTLRGAEPTVRGSIFPGEPPLAPAGPTSATKRHSVNVTVTELAPCKKQIRIEITPAEVDAALDKVGKEYARHASLPGFRPGKSPIHMVLKRYAEDIREEARLRLINEKYRAALEEQKLDVVGQPELEEITAGGVQAGQEFVLLATVEVEPAFELPPYKGLAIKRPSADVSDAAVNHAIDLLRGKHSTFDLVAREARPGDIAVVNYTGTCDGQAITEIAPAARSLNAQKNFWVSLEPEAFLPGFPEQLAGTKAGDRVTITVNFPAEFNPRPLAGKVGTYAVEVVEVRERKLPELTDELAKKWGATTVEEFRKGVRADLEQDARYRQRRALQAQLVEALVSKVTCDLPESAVSQQTKQVAIDIVRENTERGVSKEVIEKEREQIYSVAANSAKDRVRLAYLVQRIAEAEKITVSNEEVANRVAGIAAYRNIPVAKFVKDLRKQNGLIEVYDQLQHEKVLAFLEQNAVIEDLPPTPAPPADAPTA